MVFSRFIFFLLVAVLMLFSLNSRADQPIVSSDSFHTVDVMINSGLLTLNAVNTPLSDVLVAIGKRAHFDVVLIGDHSTPVNVSFHRRPLWEGINQLLGDTNRAVAYAPDPDNSNEIIVSKLWVLGGHGETEVLQNGNVGEADDLREDIDTLDANSRSKELLRLVSLGPTEEVLKKLTFALLNDSNPLVRSRAAIALGSLGDARALSALEVATTDENLSVRIQAIQALGEIGGKKAVEILGEILVNSGDSRQRVVAAWALGKQNTELAQQYLAAATYDPDDQVRKAVVAPPEWIQSSEQSAIGRGIK